MEVKTYTFIVVILFLMSQYDSLYVKMTNVRCEVFNKSLVSIQLCRLKAIKRNLTVLNIEGELLHSFNDISLHIELMKRENGYKPFLFNVTVDGCRFMKKNYHPVAKLVLNIFKDFSTVNHTCPYAGKQMVKDFYFQPESVRGLPFPSGDFFLSLIWIFVKTPAFLTKVYFTAFE